MGIRWRLPPNNSPAFSGISRTREADRTPRTICGPYKVAHGVGAVPRHAATALAALEPFPFRLKRFCSRLANGFARHSAQGRCGASFKRCNVAKRCQTRTLRAGTFFCPAASRILTVAPLRSAILSLQDRRMPPAKRFNLNGKGSKASRIGIEDSQKSIPGLCATFDEFQKTCVG
ncbi:hypothetical protein ABIE64_000955 [Thalassospira sp. MBR-102]